MIKLYIFLIPEFKDATRVIRVAGGRIQHARQYATYRVARVLILLGLGARFDKEAPEIG